VPKRTKHIQMRESVGPVWLSKSFWGADSIWPQLWFQANGPKLLPFAALAMPPRARTWKKLWVMTCYDIDWVGPCDPCDGYWWIPTCASDVWSSEHLPGTEWHRMAQALWVWLPLCLKSWLICPNLHCNLQADSNFQATGTKISAPWV